MNRLFFVIFFCLLLLYQSLFAQDTTKKKIDTTYKPTKFILSDNKYHYINPTNPDTITRKRFLWYPLKSFDDVFNYLPGYYLRYRDVGQATLLSYNQNTYAGILRNGRPTYDFDLNQFSRNEIAEVEVTSGFENYLYNYSNVINIVQRQIFQNRPYTEIAFWQDRYENLYFDGNYHQNIFKNLNFNFGVTKHSYTGKYKNSEFDKWQGRFNFNLAASNKLNFFLYSNYSKIIRGLNGGLNPYNLNLGNKEEVFNATTANVVSPDSYEKKETFDIDAGCVLLAGKTSFTKLQLFMSNSFTEYRSKILSKDDFLRSQFAAKFLQQFKVPIWKVNVILRSEGEYNNLRSRLEFILGDQYYFHDVRNPQFYFLQNVELKYKELKLEGYVKDNSTNNFSYNLYGFGGRISYEYSLDTATKVNVGVYINSKHYSSGFNFKFSSKYFDASSDYYFYQAEVFDYASIPSFVYLKKNVNGLNNRIRLRLFKFDIDAIYTINLYNYEGISKHLGNISFAFHDMAFKNKLEYKIGLSSLFWSKYKYNPISLNEFPANATLDFYIIGKIDKATFGITFENILNRVIYNTAIYPFMDRGGLANFISRFNITWNFLK